MCPDLEVLVENRPRREMFIYKLYHCDFNDTVVDVVFLQSSVTSHILVVRTSNCVDSNTNQS